MSGEWNEYPSNFSNGQEVNSISTFFDYLDSASHGYFGLMIQCKT